MIDLAHREAVAALHATSEGMTDSPSRGLSTSRGAGTGARTRPRAIAPTGARTDTNLLPLNSVRRPASASRTCGRCAVDPPGRSLTPTPHRGAPTSRRRTPRKKINTRNYRLTGPAPSGMTISSWARPPDRSTVLQVTCWSRGRCRSRGRPGGLVRHLAGQMVGCAECSHGGRQDCHRFGSHGGPVRRGARRCDGGRDPRLRA